MSAFTLSLKASAQLLLSIAIILGCLAVAKVIMQFTQGSFPAPLLGMLLLLGLLLTGLIKEHHVTPSASPLLNYMPLFFIPAGVGFIALFGVAVLNGIVLISYFNQLKNQSMKKIKGQCNRSGI